MPLYEFYCPRCEKQVSVTLTLKEREVGKVACPQCGHQDLRPMVATFFAQTSKKS
jgi:putative FmdB family regulatory protein